MRSDVTIKATPAGAEYDARVYTVPTRAGFGVCLCGQGWQLSVFEERRTRHIARFDGYEQAKLAAEAVAFGLACRRDVEILCADALETQHKPSLNVCSVCGEQVCTADARPILVV